MENPNQNLYVHFKVHDYMIGVYLLNFTPL
jgi:hypothetical protein